MNREGYVQYGATSLPPRSIRLLSRDCSRLDDADENRWAHILRRGSPDCEMDIPKYPVGLSTCMRGSFSSIHQSKFEPGDSDPDCDFARYRLRSLNITGAPRPLPNAPVPPVPKNAAAAFQRFGNGMNKRQTRSIFAHCR